MSNFPAPRRRAAQARRADALRRPAGARAALIRAAAVRGVFSAAAAAIALQAALRLPVFGGIDHATRCVHLAGQLARAGIALAIVSVSPDCPAETVAPGGDARHLVVWAGVAALAVGLIHIGTSAQAVKMCRSVRALVSINVWRRVLVLADAPMVLPRRRTGTYREPACSPRRPWRGFCGTRGPPVAA